MGPQRAFLFLIGAAKVMYIRVVNVLGMGLGETIPLLPYDVDFFVLNLREVGVAFTMVVWDTRYFSPLIGGVGGLKEGNKKNYGYRYK